MHFYIHLPIARFVRNHAIFTMKYLSEFLHNALFFWRNFGFFSKIFAKKKISISHIAASKIGKFSFFHEKFQFWGVFCKSLVESPNDFYQPPRSSRGWDKIFWVLDEGSRLRRLTFLKRKRPIQVSQNAPSINSFLISPWIVELYDNHEHFEPFRRRQPGLLVMLAKWKYELWITMHATNLCPIMERLCYLLSLEIFYKPAALSIIWYAKLFPSTGAMRAII